MKQGDMKVRFYETGAVPKTSRLHKDRPAKTKVTTECVIYVEGFNDHGNVISCNTFHGFSHCSHKDDPSIFKGRKLALERALAIMGSNGVFIAPERVTKLLSVFSGKIIKK